MRSTPAEHAEIPAASRAMLRAGIRVMLFGSRTDDWRRGGNIDLLVARPSAADAPQIVETQTRPAARLWLLVVERRIDTLAAPEGVRYERLSVAEARRQVVEPVKT